MISAFIGGGNMASALIGGLVAKGCPVAGFRVVEPHADARARLAAACPGLALFEAAGAAAVAGADIVVLAVKPQQMHAACTALAPHVATVPVVLSIAAGTRSGEIVRWLGGQAQTAMDEFRRGAEEEADRFSGEALEALRQDVRALLSLRGSRLESPTPPA